jgi:RNA polymerase sigma factor (sigma-70 family)
MDDQRIIEVYLAHQAPNCFRLLYERYAGKIYAKSLTILNNAAAAEDVTQEIFAKIFLSLDRFGGKSKFSTWVYSVTYNYCIDYIRRNKKQRRVFSDEEIEKAPDLAEEVPDHELMQMEVRQLKTVLDELPVKDKAILLMKYQDGMSIREIAAGLDKTESAVKMQIKRAKEKARHIHEQLFATTEQ